MIPEILGVLTTLLGIIAGWQAYNIQKQKQKHDREMKDKDARLEEIESLQIKIQSDANAQATQLDILKSSIANQAESDKRWHHWIDERSKRDVERDMERETRMLDVLERLNTSIYDNTQSVANMSQVAEIQSVRYVELVTSNRETTQSVMKEAKATRASVDTIKSTIEKSFNLVQSALTTLQKRFDDITELEETHIEAQGARHDEQIDRSDGLRDEIRSLSSAITTMSDVIDNTHKLVQEHYKIENEETP